ncbi:siphovirus Gp157 family protein [Lentilactobacillus kosonis]|uniref:Uncharacterized protein n=1 Tax=Lentilactobacillus kosonis TaxID=2810561 RepID=A0A401FPC1_9LACO|nr:siphovirus Gp157 family protein [Lentilactobacillus kosonis]GAY74239.1 hypothetical protein NBRC111893_2385 [Lentilactobacillus kosonis]
MQTSLYDLTQAINDLQNREDLDPEIIKDTLDSLQDSRDKKIENIATWIDSLQANVDFNKNKKLKKLKNSTKAKAT